MTNNLKLIATLLASIGALNWGLVGVADYNLVAYLFQAVPAVERLIYILVGLSGIYTLWSLIDLYVGKETPKATRK